VRLPSRPSLSSSTLCEWLVFKLGAGCGRRGDDGRDADKEEDDDDDDDDDG
jgi:hypothetical protein